MNTLVGIDKVALILPVEQVVFRPDADLIIENPEEAATGQRKFIDNLYHDGERWRIGKEAHKRTENWQLQVDSGKGRGGPVAILQWSGGAFKNTNEVPLQKDELAQTARDVRDELLSFGIDFPVDLAHICRLDVCRQHEMSVPIATFSPVFHSLQTMKRLPKTVYGDSGLLALNGQREWNWYDKGEELRIKRPKMDAYPVNVLRSEMRLKKSAVVKKQLGFNTLPGLQTAWEALHPAYIASLKGDLFREKIEENAGASLDFYELARWIAHSDAKRKLQALKSKGFMIVLVKNMGLNLAKHFLATELGIDGSTAAGKKQIKRVCLELEQAEHALRLDDNTSDGTPLRELYHELKRTLLN